ncbi:MAG: DUF2075 domain-containing protein [Clostridia bacterium]|nr:DUF2075 domain-containing protein [Clostridia bacterium]
MSKNIDFEITTYDYKTPDYSTWRFPYNYHYLYILENGKDVYIGETNDIIVRTKQHHTKDDHCYKFNFSRIHVITGKHMEETPAKHYERLLVKLMEIDGKFDIRNRKQGEKTFYRRKNEFELGFDNLWPKLADINLVSHKQFQAILNRPEYKYSPYTSLTDGQIATLTNIVNAIHTSDSQRNRNAGSRPILIEGDAGTGKTVIASSLFYHLKSNPNFAGKNIGLVYSNTATRNALKNTFRCVSKDLGKHILRPIDVTKKHYDIIICDETHRLRRNKNLGMYVTHFRNGNARVGLDDTCDELDWLLKNSDCLVLLYDKQQIASPSDIPSDIFSQRLDINECGTRPVELQDQMRIRAGAEYVPYIHAVLNQKTVDPKRFDNYDFKLFLSFSDMIHELRKKEETMGLSRVCSGYAWKWSAKNSPETPDISIDGIDIWWNTQTSGWLDNPQTKNEMGSIYSLPGLDLNYAAVVIGPDLYFDTATNKIQVKKKRFFDNKVKRNSTDEELKQFVINTYGVLLTRGIYGTYVYVCDDALRSYLKKFIPTI